MKKRRVSWAAFGARTEELIRIPVTPEVARYVVEEVRRLFPYRDFRPTVQFSNRNCRRRGVCYRELQIIRLYRQGQTLQTLLHEMAHILAPTRGHNKDFYFTCDLLEQSLFGQESFTAYIRTHVYNGPKESEAYDHAEKGQEPERRATGQTAIHDESGPHDAEKGTDPMRER